MRLQLAWRGGLLGWTKFQDYITISPEVRGGKPCIMGRSITVADSWNIWLAE